MFVQDYFAVLQPFNYEAKEPYGPVMCIQSEVYLREKDSGFSKGLFEKTEMFASRIQLFENLDAAKNYIVEYDKRLRTVREAFVIRTSFLEPDLRAIQNGDKKYFHLRQKDMDHIDFRE